MDITFINPVLGGDYSALDIGLTCLATLINKRSTHNARILDFTFHRRVWKKKLFQHITKYRPDVIGFSANNLYLRFIIRIIKEIKKIDPNITIICGGYEASIYPKKILGLDNVDYVFTGDAEESLIEFLDKSENNQNQDRVPGIWYLNKQGKIISNPGSFYNNLDDLPYLDWELWEDLDKYLYFLGMLYQMGSRGCVYNCTFCEAREIRECIKGPYYRKMSPKRFAEELAWDWEKYRKRGLKIMQLFDPIPTMDKEWLREFTSEYKKRVDPRKSKYSLFSRVNHLDEEKIRMLAESGCNMVRMGIESGDEFIRNKVMKKQLDDKKIWQVVRLLKKYKIKMTAYYILGAPNETKKSIQKTLSMAKKIDGERTAYFIFKPLTKESIELIKKYGGKINQRKSEKADNLTFDAVLDNKELSAAQIERYQIKAYLSTFPRRLWKLIKKDKLRYFSNLIKYLWRGKKHGLDFKYLISYFHIYGYNNIYE